MGKCGCELQFGGLRVLVPLVVREVWEGAAGSTPLVGTGGNVIHVTTSVGYVIHAATSDGNVIYVTT